MALSIARLFFSDNLFFCPLWGSSFSSSVEEYSSLVSMSILDTTFNGSWLEPFSILWTVLRCLPKWHVEGEYASIYSEHSRHRCLVWSLLYTKYCHTHDRHAMLLRLFVLFWVLSLILSLILKLRRLINYKNLIWKWLADFEK